jgi:hypothetical protein
MLVVSSHRSVCWPTSVHRHHFLAVKTLAVMEGPDETTVSSRGNLLHALLDSTLEHRAPGRIYVPFAGALSGYRRGVYCAIF